MFSTILVDLKPHGSCLVNRASLILGLTHSEFPEKRYGPDGANWKVYRMVPMSYISWIQQQEVWDQSIHPIFPSQLKLPDRGFPVSIGYDLTTTLTREEIQREKLELIGMDAETIKNMGLFGPPESKSTLSSIQLLRESLRETGQSGSMLTFRHSIRSDYTSSMH